MRTVTSAIRSLVALGKSQGHLSFSQVSETIQQSPNQPELLDQILQALEEAGIEVIEAEE